MDTSILYSVKSFLGIGIDNCAFDEQIIMYINMALQVLTQLGASEHGDMDSLGISGMEETWQDFLGPYDMLLSMAKTYTGMYVRLYFDPPSNSFTVASVEKQIEQLTWRIAVEVEELERRGVSEWTD